MNKCTIWGGHLSKKAFTLIELLAVIVILAIIALIAVPIILNIINDSKEQSIIRSAELYEKAVLNAVMEKQLDGKTQIEEGEYTVQNDESICIIYDGNCKEESKIKIEIDGEKPKVGSTITIEDNEIIVANFTIEEKKVIKENGKYIANNSQIETICKYANEGKKGSIGGKYKCDVDPNIEENYYFYILEKNANNVILLMDNNVCSDGTIATQSNPCTVAWNSTGQNFNTPVTLNDYLNTLKTHWTQTSVILGIPSADQVASADGLDYLYHPLLNSSWLYSNLSPTASDHPNGYWTSTPSDDVYANTNIKFAWEVHRNPTYDSIGHISESFGITVNTFIGLRPIITIPISLLN